MTKIKEKPIEDKPFPTPKMRSKDPITVVVPGTVPYGPVAGERTFTLEEHGEDYAETAEAYRVRFKGKIVD